MKNIIIIFLLVITVGAITVAAYFYGKSNQVSYTPTATINPTSNPTTVPATADKGTVEGRLCYPSSLLPKGQIVAKNTTSGEVFNQNFAGSENGGNSNYSFSLPVGTYYLKYDATIQNNTLSGFYTDYSVCVTKPDDPVCPGQKTRPLLPVEVKAGSVVKDINLCDFYYPPDNPPKF